jgi:23S rRNA (pseudouridine1915-N3)-methyltransferase
LIVAAVGRLKAGPERDLCSRYAGRIDALSKTVHLGPVSVVEIAEGSARSAAERKTAEGKALLTAVPDSAYVVALDETGRSESSLRFAEHLAQERNAGRRDMVFLIGGADGLSAEALRAAQLTLCFGAMTLPHQLVRVLVLEQLYRAATVLSGHPYHRA